MDLNLTGKRVLITGASKGIGAAIATRFAMEGCEVILVARSRQGLELTRDEIRSATGRKAEIAAADMAKPGVAAELAQAFPDVDILVNNAGEDPMGTLTEVNEERWRKAWDVKVFGYLNMCREYYSVMKQRGGGVIVNIIGVANIIKSADYICGATSTAVISTLSQTLGGRSLEDNIRVVGVGPGVTATPRILRARDKHPEAFEDLDGADDRNIDLIADRLAQGNGLARSGRADEVAALVTFIASPQAGYISGSVVNIDGGWSRS